MQLPENYDRRYRGPVTIRHALACSLNVPALRELDALGGPEKLQSFLQSLGISSLGGSSTEYGLGLTLGNAPVRLLELTNAYAAIARRGDFLPTRLFMEQEISAGKDLIDPAACWLIADILSDKAARAPSFPNGGPLDLPFPCAVKTGTSSDFRDNWCVGFTPEFTVGVWAGNFENQPMKNISGVSGAGPIFHRSLVRAHRDTQPTWFARPDGGERVEADTRTGKRLPPCELPTFSVKEWLPPGTGIPGASPTDYDESGRAKLPPVYAEWYASEQNLRRQELVIDTVANPVPLQILRPLNHSTILLDPELPGNGSTLRLLTNLPEFVKWSCETLAIEGIEVRLSIGRHIFVATDLRDGSRHQVTVTVKSL